MVTAFLVALVLGGILVAVMGFCFITRFSQNTRTPTPKEN